MQTETQMANYYRLQNAARRASDPDVARDFMNKAAQILRRPVNDNPPPVRRAWRETTPATMSKRVAWTVVILGCLAFWLTLVATGAYYLNLH